MAEYQLLKEIMELSRSQRWNEARLEWKLIHVYRVEEFQPCLCGHTPIKELWLIQNQKTSHKATVGNRCVRRFLAMDSNKQFEAFKRVIFDNNRSFDLETMHMAIHLDWIDCFDMNLYLSILGKRNVDQERLKRKRLINQIIINQILR